MSDIILAITMVAIFTLTAVLLATTKPEERGCDRTDCDKCPFPSCNN